MTVFFSGPATKAPPPPLELIGYKKFSRLFFRASKNGLFLSGQALTPPHPLLVAGPLKKDSYFSSASLSVPYLSVSSQEEFKMLLMLLCFALFLYFLLKCFEINTSIFLIRLHTFFAAY